jgi:hypothetical protein
MDFLNLQSWQTWWHDFYWSNHTLLDVVGMAALMLLFIVVLLVMIAFILLFDRTDHSRIRDPILAGDLQRPAVPGSRTTCDRGRFRVHRVRVHRARGSRRWRTGAAVAHGDAACHAGLRRHRGGVVRGRRGLAPAAARGVSCNASARRVHARR